MPIYEYLCEDCGHEFETIRKFSDPPLRECPACHAERLVKKISAAGFRLKGGGWYETDFKGGSKRNVAGESGSDSSSAGSNAGSTDSSSAPSSAGSTAGSSAGSSAGSTAGSTGKGGGESKSGGDSSTAKTASAD